MATTYRYGWAVNSPAFYTAITDENLSRALRQQQIAEYHFGFVCWITFEIIKTTIA